MAPFRHDGREGDAHRARPRIASASASRT
jgi:hypothetical protein